MTTTQTEQGIDARHFRNVLGHFPTGVVAITSTDAEGNPVGMAVGSFTSVSLDPPLVAFLPDKGSSTFPKIRESGRFCANILTSSQQDVCRNLARKGADKFAHISWSMSDAGTPRIDDALGWVDCEIQHIHDAGDHYIVLGSVNALDVDRRDSPLIFFQGGYGRFASTSLTAPAEADLFQPLRLVDQARGEMNEIANDLGVECCASTRIGNQLVLIGSSMAHGLQTAPHTRMGQRMPFMPPLALPLIAWHDSASIAKWVDSAPDVLDRGQLTAAVQRVRERGWSLVLRSREQIRFERAVADLPLHNATKEQTEELTDATASLKLEGYEPVSIDPRKNYCVRIITAPVFDPNGNVALILSLYQMPHELSGVETNRYRERLVQGANTVTAALGGNRPA
jgi:flavin reductase (DIM6/NTAB) family NADH-FMN oxidoreductase RutF/DNA-binding IclR family transcriptional regulator